ncbi:MAG: pyridoxal phosphate-dependent aminotransferase [Bacteroidales bacterium]|uniref:MalY/PatB family protein n=1 Tax=Porphyromonas sp. TaxID=1924944 RepID=UPI00297AF08F|nr:MalY/PatB family protein [Porphyromonas sp.]MDD7438221.1 pyridoxal phosphate-dependent aminotransferase [Bacteroidales bacterium]MDY3066460.1 MalY/PatB family protein [Porphyromonas sp.]
MKYNFDKILDRNHTDCTKYDGYGSFESEYKEILPLWVADMDFATPPFVLDAIRRRLEHPVLGYTVAPSSYYEAIQGWFERHYGFRPLREELEHTPGVVSGIYKLIECLTEKGDGILITPPVYHPFSNVINASGRKMIEAPLRLIDGRQEIDWELLESRMKDANIFLISHPHNPGGRVWSRGELERIAQIAKANGALVISDEIHADLTFKPHKHIPFPSVSSTAAEVGITLMAPSKAFNMPGVIGSHFYIKDPVLRKRIFHYMEANGLAHASAYTYDAIAAAYREGDEWSEQCLDYVLGNIDYVRRFLEERIPNIKMIEPEASFLIFLDCRGLGFGTTEELNDFFIRKAGLFLNDGKMFGTGGDYFMRLNVGSPRSTIEEAMRRLEKAVNNL